ncbi:hypothetical protein [Nonomuraea typhae]|uniref:Uncharacterized protein n=1 Tax=Nonomuraea typhae TaxID=2603600 RepID=A0ABW7Z8R7_9ACTN
MIKNILVTGAVALAAAGGLFLVSGGPAGASAGDRNARYVCLTYTNWIAAERTSGSGPAGDVGGAFSRRGERLSVLSSLTASRSLSATLSKGYDLSEKAVKLAAGGKSTAAIDKQISAIEKSLLSHCS